MSQTTFVQPMQITLGVVVPFIIHRKPEEKPKNRKKAEIMVID